MYVCICHAVTEKQVRQAVDDGATDVKSLKQKLGVGSECGRCIQATLEVIQAQTDAQPRYYEVA
ncbi:MULTISPECIES: (2Fe-2S)-binding protein [Ferrimonas]|uniref:(2Fe-2S)-binding protein n=1 Tax=Ferrimonas TaxID=44011 RepID=UPI0004287248|nr:MULTISPECIES: (2Fe-2S)-binding protein [Ferrimonas]BDY06572.1 (2Fe-2S)-binding protein [Ferrimonas sp. YFM]